MIEANFLEAITLFEVKAEVYKFEGIDNNLLKDEVLEQQTRMSNDPSFSFFEDTVFQPKPNGEGEKLIKKIDEFGINKGLIIKEYWSHIHQPLESAWLHHHKPYSLSFVYYVSVPNNSGSIVFEFENEQYYTLTPTESVFILFPSWVKHKVTKNLSDSIRISIAGNFE
jgi:hypothetical protein